MSGPASPTSRRRVCPEPRSFFGLASHVSCYCEPIVRLSVASSTRDSHSNPVRTSNMSESPSTTARTDGAFDAAVLPASPRTPFESGIPESRQTDRPGAPSGTEQGETLGAMTEIAVHEISNVLQWLKMTLRVIERDATPDDLPLHFQASLIPAVRDASLGVDHIADIVRELRNVRRPHVGEPEAFDPAEALRTALKIAGSRLTKWARVIEEIWPVPHVRGREHDLVCVFLNLLLNAAEAISEGASDGHAVTARAAVDPRGGVLFEVEDTGCGVPPEIAERIFDPYVTSRRGRGGSGLGLHICRRVVRDMGGRLGFDHGPDRGTRFWIVLPPIEQE